MVSDVLADGVTGLNHYLTSPTFADMYSGWLRTEVVRVRNEMLALGQFLDCPPPPEGKPYPVGKTDQEYYQHLHEQCLKLEAVYPGMYVPDDVSNES